MNRQRYASITSHLLVRKGEAKPWQVPGTEQHEFGDQLRIAHQPRQAELHIVPELGDLFRRRRFLQDFADGVVPLLQQRGLFRTEYEGSTLREHFRLRRPVSRHLHPREAAATA